MDTFSLYGKYASQALISCRAVGWIHSLCTRAPVFCREAEWMISVFSPSGRKEAEAAGACRGAGADWSWLSRYRRGSLNRLSGVRSGRLKKIVNFKVFFRWTLKLAIFRCVILVSELSRLLQFRFRRKYLAYAAGFVRFPRGPMPLMCKVRAGCRG